MTTEAVTEPTAAVDDIVAAATPAHMDVNHGGVGTVAIGAGGPMNTGTGSQFAMGGQDNDYKLYFEMPGRQRRFRDQRVTSFRVEWLRDRFVAPANFLAAADQLAQPTGVVLLVGSSGIGRRTAAHMLLCPEPGAGNVVRLLPAELEAQAVEADRRAYNGDDVQPGERLLLDLSEVGTEAFRELQDFLPSLQPAVADQRAKLVVVLAAEHEDSLRPDYRPYLVRIGSPDPISVLARHLESAGLRGEREHLITHREKLRSASMAAVERLAERIMDARARDPRGSFERWLVTGFRADEQRREQIERFLAGRVDAPSRALALAAATLEGGTAEAVFSAQQLLLKNLDYESEPRRTLIELDGVVPALTDLDLSVGVDPRGRVHFEDEELAPRIVEYFWDELPWLRNALADWLTSVVADVSLRTSDLTLIADRVADQCIRNRQSELAVRLAREWADHSSLEVRSAGYQLLGRLLSDERTAAPTRHHLYWWSRDRQLSPRLSSIVIAACVEVLAEMYLDQAVVRLSWLAQHENGSVRYQARDALKKLAEREDRRDEVLQLLLEGSRFRAQTFASVVPPIVATTLPTTDDGSMSTAVRGWQRVLDASDAGPAGRFLVAWLDCHADLLDEGRAHDAERLLRRLAAVCRGASTRLDTLFTTNREWIDAAADAEVLQRRLRTAILVEQTIREIARSTDTSPRKASR
ncbi:hypothetical protein [Kribbella sp. ALI-6-A]|uniref:hypothetical protein n=1 Tax=Kribbella sp. ALI-6-A TaxID=1933817 RepID=UPI001179B066|nr:hypothetical protein [Kribbella sp. ALI-6-A]